MASGTVPRRAVQAGRVASLRVGRLFSTAEIRQAAETGKVAIPR